MTVPMQPILSLGANSVGAAELMRLKHAIGIAAARLPFAVEWRENALAETADVLLVDVDTVYGHVDWLRAQAGGRALIALTSRPNGAHDNELARDADPSALEALLIGFESLAHVNANTSTSTTDKSLAASMQTPAMDVPVAASAGSNSRLVATRELPALVAGRAAAYPSGAVTVAESKPVEPPPPPRESMSLHDWLCAVDGVDGIAALQTSDGEQVIVDRAQSIYYGPAALKPLMALSRATIARGDWQRWDAATLSQRSGSAVAMPLARLRLVAGLGAFDGALGGALDPTLPFRLPKWPQIEREFPRHMRIATALMKGPATIDELVSQLGLPYTEVADFLNAFVAAGFIEQVMPVIEQESAPPAAGERLMGRLRAFGRRS